jgi:GNAT superfamily N-acetyltransferase
MVESTDLSATEVIAIQRERLSSVHDEILPLLEKHWQEIALNRDKIRLAPDWESYWKKDECGDLHIITVRIDGKLVGYHVAFLLRHLHYQEDVIAATDIYYIDPQVRGAGIGASLFLEVERSLRSLGVKKIVSMTKIHQDHGKLLTALGYEAVETVYSKYIGE